MASATVSNPSPTALTFVKRRDASFPSRSHQQRDIVRFRPFEWLIVIKADRSPPLTLRAQRSEPVNKEILP
jgi:hypothetical protein